MLASCSKEDDYFMGPILLFFLEFLLLLWSHFVLIIVTLVGCRSLAGQSWTFMLAVILIAKLTRQIYELDFLLGLLWGGKDDWIIQRITFELIDSPTLR